MSLDRAAYKDVSVRRSRDKGIMTLCGHVSAGNYKLQAEAIANTIAHNPGLSNQIAVLPMPAKGDTKVRLHGGVPAGAGTVPPVRYRDRGVTPQQMAKAISP